MQFQFLECLIIFFPPLNLVLLCEHVQSDFSEDQILGELIFNVHFCIVMSLSDLYLFNKCLT